MPDTARRAARRAATTRPALDLSSARHHFPSLALEQDGQPVVYFDNPAGTQVPQACIDAFGAYYTGSNSNTGGAFVTSRRTDALIAEARAAMADFLNAPDPREIVFGPNMTTITFALARSLGRTMQPGDEIVLTTLEHDANVAPWLTLADDLGLVVRVAEITVPDCTLDMEHLRSLINERTKLVAVAYASNVAGTINDVATICAWAREAGALSLVDAVHYGPHGPMDVQAIGCDFLACSSYKFFGPHLGILYGRLELLERLYAYKVRPAHDEAPSKWETGTLSHECLAGLVAALDYLAAIGRDYGAAYADQFPGMSGRRLELHSGLAAIQEYERGLSRRLLAGLAALPGVHIWGIGAEGDLTQRVPTISITVDGHRPEELAAKLGERGIFTWEGNYYALYLIQRLGLMDAGGTLRIGLVHYNTPDEIERCLDTLGEIIGA